MAAVNNENRKIATTASGLVHTTVGATDQCKHEITKVPAPFSNHAKFDEAKGHTSPKTLMAGGMVIRIGDEVGGEAGPKSHPAHPPHTLKLDESPYRQEARATQGAPNVKCEDVAPARFMDRTTQNACNTTGIVFDLALAAQLAQMEADQKKRCSLKEDEITCKHPKHKAADENTRILEVTSGPAKGASSAPLGASTGANAAAGLVGAKLEDEDSAEEITFKAKRRNAVEDGEPDCRFGEGPNCPHTAWVIHRVAGGGLSERRETPHGDTFIMDHSWLDGSTPIIQLSTNQPDVPASSSKRHGTHPHMGGDVQPPPQAPTPPPPFTPATPKDIDRRGREIHNSTPGGANGTGRQQARAEEAQRAQANQDAQRQHAAQVQQYNSDRTRHTRRSMINGAAQLGAQVFNLRQFLKVYNWRRDPVRINVQAQACTGALNAEILAFPSEEVDFKFGQPEYEIVQAISRPINSFAHHFRGVSRTLGIGSFDLRFFEEPEIGVKCQWKELDEDAPKVGLKKYQCSRSSQWFISIKKIIGLNIEIRFPLAYLLNFIPGLGWAVDKVLSLVADCSCGLGVQLDFGLGLSLDVTEKGNYGGNLNLFFRFQFYIYVRIRFGRRLHAEGRAVLKWEPSLSGPHYEDDKGAYCKLDRGDIRIGFTLTLTVSAWWWERDFSGEIWPESWRYVYAECELPWVRPILARLGM